MTPDTISRFPLLYHNNSSRNYQVRRYHPVHKSTFAKIS